MPTRSLWYVLVLSIWLAACNEAQPETELYTEEVDIIVQAMLIEAVLQDGFSQSQRDSLTTIYYGQLYDRFGIDAKGLDNMRTRISQHPELWQELADSVAVRLDSARTDFKGFLKQ